jgi:hypothetical protein
MKKDDHDLIDDLGVVVHPVPLPGHDGLGAVPQPASSDNAVFRNVMIP